MIANRTSHIQSRGLAAGYAAGRAQVRKLIEDRARFEFVLDLWRAWCVSETSPALTEVEQAFCCRIVAETNEESPDLHPGDANICDGLKRKYNSYPTAATI
jgi:hypothetical protein